jgi:hypothetical protein
MTTEHRRWTEFAERLGGPEGCDFREDARSVGAARTRVICPRDRCSDSAEAKGHRDRGLRFVARGEGDLLAGLRERRHRQ